MAKKRFFARAARTARRYGRKAYRASSKSQPSLMTAGLFGLGYGAARPFVAGFVKPVSNYLPFGSMNDEIAMGLMGFAAAKYGSGIVRNIGRTALIVESASAGAQLTSGMATSQTTFANNFSY